jgi:integrase
MEILGHSQISITLNTYTHVDPGLSRVATDRLEELLWPQE